MRFTTSWRAVTLVVLYGMSVALPIPITASAAMVKEKSAFILHPGALVFYTSPDVPDLPALTLDGADQTLNGTLNEWRVRDATGSSSGWNVSVQGDSSAGNSAVFKEYCTDGLPENGCDTAVGGGPGPGYVTSGESLEANSLVLNSAGASFNAYGGSGGTPPTHSCDSSCNVDSASPVTIASAPTGSGMGTYGATGYSQSSLSLSTPMTIKAIGTGNKVYRVDLVWTLASGPS